MEVAGVTRSFSITEESRQLLILGVALAARLRPGMDYAMEQAAWELGGKEMFGQFKEANDHIEPEKFPDNRRPKQNLWPKE
jgi:hypothetical protein